MKKQRYTVYYRGQVQGVGFRYSVCRLAGRFDVKGFVRNLADGRVQVVTEGQTDELDLFLQAVESQMDSYIKERELDQQEPTGEFPDFSLRW
ncbi:MAG: acylphosphatase [Actinobacteria bacterium]|nr:acylphosphatase [Actinomycetota bacterium]